MCCRVAHTPGIQMLIQPNIFCPQDGRDLIHAAAHSGNLELVQWLVDRHTAEPSQLVVRLACIINLSCQTQSTFSCDV